MGHHRYEPRLEAPGAGLPWLETFFGRYWLLKRGPRRSSWEENGARFVREGEKLLSIARGLPVEQLGVRVLIPRIPGIEDSTRFWSIAMVLEHLMIVGRAMGFVATELTHGRPPGVEVDIVQVKPPENVDLTTIVERYERFVHSHAEDVERGLGDRDSPSTHVHPWFGGLTARQWHWLMTQHQAIHRKQAELIVRGLHGERLGLGEE